MAGPSHILVYGREQILLQTRRSILERGGFEVWVTMKLAEIEQACREHDVEVLVLCHTLSKDDCEQAIKVAHAHRPKMQALVLTATGNGCGAGPEDKVLSVYEGPSALILTVDKMLGGAAI